MPLDVETITSDKKAKITRIRKAMIMSISSNKVNHICSSDIFNYGKDYINIAIDKNIPNKPSIFLDSKISNNVYATDILI